MVAATQPIFAKQPGFISASLHRSMDGIRFTTYLQWCSEANHDACMQNPDWNTAAGVKL